MSGGARIRPTILLSVAMACGDDRPALSDAAAAALELIHCASLVHDDLPAFDDADMRRGKPIGPPRLWRAVGGAGRRQPDRAGLRGAGAGGGHQPGPRAAAGARRWRSAPGMPGGICAGQGWEVEPTVNLSAYHRAKTGALFIAATQMGAIAAGQEPEPWEELGARIGEAFQVADDLNDALLTEAETGQAGRAGCGPWPPECGGADGRAGRDPASEGHSGRGDRLDPVLPGRGAAGRSWSAPMPSG